MQIVRTNEDKDIILNQDIYYEQFFNRGLNLEAKNLITFIEKQIYFSYDSIPIQEKDLTFGGKRLLEVSKPLYIPTELPIRFLITSADVLHSWAVPEFGIKTDAVPGRLNQVITTVYKPGFFFGQCSELCGVAHYYMPIAVEAMPLHIFLDLSLTEFTSSNILEEQKDTNLLINFYSNEAFLDNVDKNINEISINEEQKVTQNADLRISDLQYEKFIAAVDKRCDELIEWFKASHANDDE